MKSVVLTAALLGASAPIALARDQASDHFGLCGDDKAACEASREQLTKEWPQAYAGRYQAQRNLSFCLADGCNGAVQQNRQLGCAWRLVILMSGDRQVDATDAGFFDAYCRERLSDLELRSSGQQADALFREIYGRKLPDTGL